MAAKPQPRPRKNGTAWRQPFRLKPGGPVTYETFDTHDDAAAFGRLVDKIGGQAARDLRTASSHAPQDALTLATWFDQHLTNVGSHATVGTVHEYRAMATRTWLPHLGPLPLPEVTKQSISAWVAAQRSTETRRSATARQKAITSKMIPTPPVTYSPKSIANAHGLLYATLQAAVDDSLIPSNPAHGIRLPSDAERVEMVILSPEEYESIHDALSVRWQRFFTTLYATGVRFGEGSAFFPEDLNMHGPFPLMGCCSLTLVASDSHPITCAARFGFRPLSRLASRSARGFMTCGTLTRH